MRPHAPRVTDTGTLSKQQSYGQEMINENAAFTFIYE